MLQLPDGTEYLTVLEVRTSAFPWNRSVNHLDPRPRQRESLADAKSTVLSSLLMAVLRMRGLMTRADHIFRLYRCDATKARQSTCSRDTSQLSQPIRAQPKIESLKLPACQVT
jgi:hypothetical protein